MTLPPFLTQDDDGFIHLTGHRIGLEHLVFYYNHGYSAEMLACEYPGVELPVIHKLIAFYLENRDEVNAYVAACQDAVSRMRAESETGPSVSELRQRLASTHDTGTS